MSLKIVQLNAENLFLLATTKENSSTDIPLSPKTLDKTTDLARAILEINADIVLLCEVGGKESLDLFNGKYLNDHYFTSLIKGNSDRGIELGYLIKKNLGLKIQHFTHKKKKIGLNQNGEPIFFSRDLAELRLISKDDPESNNPKLIILHSHLKSKWDRSGLDPLGKKQRKLEVDAMVETYLTHKSNHPNTPCLITGDLNGVAKRSGGEDEFCQIFNQTDLFDILEVIDLPENLRTTFIHFEKDSPALPQQLDYIFIPKALIPHVDKENSGIYQYLDDEKRPKPHPQNSFERYLLPSDHYPVVLSLKNFNI